jgi:hypothetical protein
MGRVGASTKSNAVRAKKIGEKNSSLALDIEEK